MSAAQTKPRRAPSLIIVKFTGPTGMDSNKPLTKPVSAAMKMAVCSGMILMGRVRFVLVFLLDFPAPCARDARSHEAIDEIEREERRQHVIKDFFAQNQQTAKKER